MELKKSLIIISSCFGALVVLILLGFSVYNLFNTLAPSWGLSGYGGSCGGGYFSDEPNFSGTCSKFSNSYELLINMNNGSKEIKNVKCQLVSKGGMNADKDEVLLPYIAPNSSDICDFTLTGQPEKSTIVRVTYSKNNFWGSKNYSTIVDIYPDCSMATEPTSPPME
jgi:hypothetical protein